MSDERIVVIEKPCEHGSLDRHRHPEPPPGGYFHSDLDLSKVCPGGSRREASRADRLRADGWDTCGTCGGTGLDPVDPFKGQPSGMDAFGHLKYSEDHDPCPDCVDGLVPPDGKVEAAADAVAEKWQLGLEDWVRAVLVAAARWESE